MKSNIQGVGVALITPFTENDEVDYTALNGLIERVSTAGVDYLVALGTTAETPTLSIQEKADIIAFIKKSNVRALPLIVGIGGNNTAEVVRNLHETDLSGVDAVLSVTPYYNKPSQRGLYEHYKVVAAESPRPVMLYNVPARTGVNMTADTTLKLAHEVDNLLGVKEACPSIGQMGTILKGRPKDFKVISGDDCMTLPLLSYGGDGVISVAANAFPEVFVRMVHAAYDNRREEAAALQLQMLEAVEALFEEGNPTGVKCALAAKGLIKNYLRLPLVPGSDALLSKFKMLIAANGL